MTHFRYIIPLILVFMVLKTPHVHAQITADFELRLAAGQTDAILSLNNAADDTLTLEVWVRVNNAAAMTVQAYTFFLNATSNGVITYNEDFMRAAAFDFGKTVGGIDNSPDSGDFSRLVLAAQPGATLGIGEFALYGSFSVSAVGLGRVDYFFDDSDPVVRPWSLILFPFITIDSDSLSGALVGPLAGGIEVVEGGPFISDADADGDADVDSFDYALMQECASSIGSIGVTLTGECPDRDLNGDAQVDANDVAVFVSRITGPLPPASPGDLDHDGDTDLADYARFQVCFGRLPLPGYVEACKLGDIDGDLDIELDDYAAFHDLIDGP